MAVDKIVTKLGGGAMKLLRLTPAGTRLAKRIEDAVDPNTIRRAVNEGKRYLQGKPSQAAQARARREGESLRSAVGAKPKTKPPRVPVGSTSKPTTSRAGQAQNLANAQARSGIAAAAREAAKKGAKPKGKPVASSRTQGKGAPRSTTTSAARQAAKRKPQETSKPTTSRAGQAQNLANAQAQAAIGAAARRANPTAAVRPKVSAGGGGGAGGKPPSKVAVGAGLGLIGGGIGAAALLAKKRAEKKAKGKGAPRSTLTSSARQAARNTTKPSKKPLKTSLRAARAAGDLYYRNPKTGKKMAAVLASDLKPGQSLTQYINKKENKTPRTPRPRRKPTQKPRGL